MTTKKPKIDLTLYLVTDSSYYEEDQFLSIVIEACRGGITLLQLREKDTEGRAYLELAQKVKRITDEYGIPLIIDDRIDVALAADAAGVHVGQSDIPVHYARQILGANKIVGATAKTVEQAVEAYEQGADYIGTGAIFPTTTKVKTILTKIETLNEICDVVPIPVIAIGGLNAGNINILENSPIKGIAVVSAIMKAEDPYNETLFIKKEIERLIEEC